MGIQPDIIVCRSEHPLDQSIKDKIALFCNVPESHVLQNLDVEYLYEAPLAMEKEQSGTGGLRMSASGLSGTGSDRLEEDGGGSASSHR